MQSLDYLGVPASEGFARASEIATLVGTPALVADLESLDGRMERAAELVRSTAGDLQLFYMAKANFLPMVLSRVLAKGLGCVVTSTMEMELATGVGFPSGALALVGPAKAERLIDAAFDHNFAYIVAESPAEAENLLARRAAVGGRRSTPAIGLRIYLELPAHQHQRVRQASEHKFGTSLAEAAAYLARRPLDMLAVNLGSQICDLSVYSRALDVLLDLISRAGEGVTINLGGGLPIERLRRLRPAVRDGQQFDEDFEVSPGDDVVTSHLRAWVDEVRSAGVSLSLEPGRWLAGPPFSLLCKVQRVEVREGRPWVYLDGGIDVIADAGFGERRPIGFITREGRSGAEPRTLCVAGPLCIRSDVFSRQIAANVLPRNGDFAVIELAGAYSFSRASWFGGQWPAVASWDGSGVRSVWKPGSPSALLRDGTAR